MWSAVELFLNSALLWIFFEVACILSVNAFYISVPWFVWGALIVTAVLWFIRIPQPDSSIVKEVLGEDLLSVKKDDLTREIREQNCMRVVAHRGGGFDYPENSLAAFRNVNLCAFNKPCAFSTNFPRLFSGWPRNFSFKISSLFPDQFFSFPDH